ncbi:MAG TPA: large conductance mechanosensitive channel protein MscL [Pseudolysinimonas sp.]|jgi:large conductance mechanosensitive channel|nr:large conductance mechanosensitive channel protein MscL [Pseudolysinimonas sp.]
MLKGFREFILRGNVIDLAVAVVIGSAFTAIVNGLVEGIFNPLISLLFNASQLETAGVILRGGEEPIVLSWGLVISALIKFVLIAAVVYFALIVPMNYLKKVTQRKKDEEKPAETPLTETDLLVQIRDLLKEQNKPTNSAG